MSTITALAAINPIGATLCGPTVSLSTSQPIGAAKTVEVSRSTSPRSVLAW